jgi:phosphoesterase RecJ-like protein
MKKTTVPAGIIAAIKRHPAFFVVPHIEPDGDCIGSALALDLFLKRIGKRSYLHCLGPFDRRDIKHLSASFAGRISDELRQREPEACAIVLDCSTIDRIGDLAADLEGLPIMVIDHHSSGQEFGALRFIESSAPATSLLVQLLIEGMGHAVTPEEAEHIFFAFCTDTGFFRHLEQKSGPAFELVARLVDAGASPKRTFAQLNSGAALGGRQHLGRLMQRTVAHAGGKLLVTWEYLAETEAVGRTNRESDLLYQMLTGIEGVEVVAVLREESADSTTVGLRSRTYVDVGKAALQFGGGGHARAAGFQAPLPLQAVRDRLVPVLEAAVNAATS